MQRVKIFLKVLVCHVQVLVVQKQCAQAKQAMQEVQNAESASRELQSQLDRTHQAMLSQQQFVSSLEAAISHTDPGESPAYDARSAAVVTYFQYFGSNVVSEAFAKTWASVNMKAFMH